MAISKVTERGLNIDNLSVSGNVSVSGTFSANGESKFISVANTNLLVNDRMQVANTNLLVNDRLQVANAEASYVSLSGDTMTGALLVSANVSVTDSSSKIIAGGNTFTASGNPYAQILATGSSGGIVINSANTNICRLMFTKDNVLDNTEGLIRYDTSDFSLQFWTDATKAAEFNSSGNLVFPNGHGIDFSAATTSGTTPSSHVFDDYEEGSFTPTLPYSDSIVYSTQTGTYTKIGRFVMVRFNIIVSSHGTGDGSNIHIRMPFAADSNAPVGLSLNQTASTLPLKTTTSNSPGVGGGITNNIDILIPSQAGNYIGYNDCNSSGTILGTAFYFAAT